MAKRNDGGHEQAGTNSQGRRADPNQASPEAVGKYMKGIDLPAGKKDLIRHAKGNNAPDDVIKVLERFREQQYGDAADIAKEVGRIE